MIFEHPYKYIGIVGCSAEGAALCYKTICIEAADYLGPHAHPQVSVHTHSLSHYVERLDRGNIDGMGDLMLSSASKLQKAGADF
jgi:aspartate racemase